MENEINFEQELYKAFGQVKDFTLGVQIAKWFYDMGRKYHEPVSEDLEKIVEEIAEPTILNAYGTKELARRLRNTIYGTSVSEELEEYVREDYMIYGSVAAVKALDRKRVCPQLKGNTLHKFKNEFNTIKQIVHLLYDYEDPFCYRVALHWASWGAYNLKSFGNINEKEKAKMDISEEPVSEDLEEEIIRYIGYPQEVDEDVSTTMIRKAARHFSNWQKQQDSKLPKIWPRDTIEEYAYQCAYDLSNDWAKETPEWNDVQNACILGAQWQKEKDMQKFLHSETATFTREEFDAEMEEVRKQTKKQMMKDAVEGVITFDYYGDGDKIYGCIAHESFCLEDMGLKDGDKVKLIIIKED